MELLPYPLSPAARRVRARRLQQRLQADSLETLIDEDLKALTDWASISDPLQRRLCRNTTLIYTRTELKYSLLSYYRMLLGKIPGGNQHG